MDRRTGYFVIAALLLIILIKHRAIIDTASRFGGFTLLPQGSEGIELAPIKGPSMPGFKTGPDMWTQTTGLMCHCEGGQYSGTWTVREITIPQPPIPRYITRPSAPEQIAAIPRTFKTTTISSDKQAWWTREPGGAFVGSDGRVFAEVAGPASTFIIDPGEYEWIDGAIHYGPYVYTKG